jgi:hypothetical protein
MALRACFPGNAVDSGAILRHLSVELRKMPERALSFQPGVGGEWL